MKALIIGAGVAGPATAMALQQAGIASTIYEAHGPDVEQGSYLTVASNGLDALRAIGARDAVIAAGFPTPWTVLESSTGKPLARLPIGSTRTGADVSHTIKRPHLNRVLGTEARGRGIAIEYGRRLVAIETTLAHVRAVFADGSSAVGDLLIGCDGVHSPTRTFIDPRAPAPRFVGLLNFGGYSRGRLVGEPGTWHMIFGARAFFGYVAGETGTVWFANAPRHAASRAERESTTTVEWKRYLSDLFADDRGPAADLIANGELELAADNTHDLPSVPTWHNGKSIIIGDAAHAPAPSSGQGASMALEDGVILAQCLSKEPGVEEAFAAFERLRRPRVERIVAQGARSSSSKAAGPIGRRVRDFMLPFVLRHLVTEKSMSWMYDHHIEWDGAALDPKLYLAGR